MNKWAFYLHLPPPLHGASKIGLGVENFALKKLKGSSVRNISLNNSLGTHARFKLLKLTKVFYLFIHVIGSILQRRKLFFYTPAISRFGVLKDFLILLPLLIVKAVKPKNYKLVFHIHSNGLNKIAEAGFVFRTLVKVIYSNNYLICLCDYHLEALKFIDAKKFKLYNFTEQISPNKLSDKITDCRKVQFLYLSNLYRSKGVIEALHLFSEIDVPNKNLKVAGPFVAGEVTRLELTNIAHNLNIADKVEIVGPVYGEAKSKLLLCSDFFIFPTKYENELFPLVVLEALASGAFVLAHPTAGIPEILSNPNLGTVSVDPEQLKIVEKDYLSIMQPSMKQYRNQHIRKYFTSDRFENSLTKIIEIVQNDI